MTRGLLISLLGLCIAGLAAASDFEAAPEGIDVEEVVSRAEAAMRGDRTYCKCEMTVSSPRLASDRKVVFESWTDGPGKRSFIRIHEP
ncbi:MAG: hypothetical protein VCC67_05230, partial [Myxococcota bacterium]